jgi:hypothetical protein
VKKEESQGSAELKMNKEVENETKSKRKTKASPDGPGKKVRKGNHRFMNVSQYPLKLAQVDKEYQHWLMKAEPDSRVVKDKDVKFR